MTTGAGSFPGVSRGIACMEVWGGSEAFDGQVSVPGNTVRVRCLPHQGGTRGGDLYYVSNCAAGLITRFVLADISGHGEGAGETAVTLRRLMRRYINTADQTAFARSLNRAFLRLGGARFATAVLLTYFAPTDHLIVCNTGHPRPLHFRASDRSWRLLDTGAPGVLADPNAGTRTQVGIANLPLGILHPMGYEQFAVPLEPGDVVLLYSDALIEAPDSDSETAGRSLGEAGVLRLVSGLDPQEHPDLVGGLLDAALRSAGAAELPDDATVIALSHDGVDPPAQTWRDRAAVLARMLGLAR